MELDSGKLTTEIVTVAKSKLAENVVAIDMRDLVAYTDYLVIATARNERQAEAIADEIHLRLKKAHGLLPVNPDRSGETGWIVLDYLGSVCHIFTEETRELYDLEELWHEAPRLELSGDQSAVDPVSAA